MSTAVMRSVRFVFTIAFLVFFQLLPQASAQSSKAESAKFKDTKNDKINKTILFFGNSLTAGYGVSEQRAFPNLIQEKIDSLGWDFNVVNAGLSGETSAGGLRRIGWVLRQEVDVFILELGGNDALRGMDLDVTRRNLQGIIDKVKTAYADARIVIAGMQVPPNLGERYTTQFRDLYHSLTQKNDAVIVPFLLEGVGGVAELNLPDRIHPNATGHRIIAENVWQVLKPVLQEMRGQ